MGEIPGKVFIEPDTLPQDGNGLVQVLFLGAVYGYILFNASGMISEGSELLLLTRFQLRTASKKRATKK
ncbi:hypothetical protein DIPPA_11218 [Diplonema papillatum]|nr:hypothetical protein DIPPA_11218 [Diplonema papillatum]